MYFAGFTYLKQILLFVFENKWGGDSWGKNMKTATDLYVLLFDQNLDMFFEWKSNIMSWTNKQIQAQSEL